MAKLFKFRLETVLRVRRQKEDEKKRIVARRIREVLAQEKHINNLQKQTIATVTDIQRQMQNGSVDVDLISRQRYWLSHLHQMGLQAQLHLRQLNQQLAQERLVLSEAAKEVKVLEKLRERLWQRYQKQLQKQEILEADDLSIGRFIYGRLHAECA